jgi:hypothetical protein
VIVFQSFEAWNNLSKAYSKMNQKFRAWMALQESLKRNYENWHIWENYIFVSTSIGKFHEVCHLPSSYNVALSAVQVMQCQIRHALVKSDCELF